MMASRCNPPNLNPRLSPLLLPLALIMARHFSVTESAAPIQLRGEVGGNVTFHCPVDKQRTFTFLYFQRGHDFVNGYYASRNVSQLAWKNTRVDHDKTTMYMFSLNVSHSGDYQCHIKYSDSLRVADFSTSVIHLSVTANYSKPALKMSCSDENFSCQVTCSSHGGYPGTKVMWNIPESQMWTVVNSSELSDPETMMVNSSSTAYFNCSIGEPMSISCSVGGVTSNLVSVCIPKDPPDSFSPSVIAAAICAVVVVSIMAASLLWWKCKKRQRGAAAVDVRQVNEYEEEVTFLNEPKEEKEAS